MTDSAPIVTIFRRGRVRRARGGPMLCQSRLAGAGRHPQTSASQIPPTLGELVGRACHRRCASALDPAAGGPRLPSGCQSRGNPRANGEADLCSRACRRRRQCRQRGRRRRRNELRPGLRHRRRPFRAIRLRANQGIGGTSSAGMLRCHVGVEAQHRVRSRGSILQTGLQRSCALPRQCRYPAEVLSDCSRFTSTMLRKPYSEPRRWQRLLARPTSWVGPERVR